MRLFILLLATNPLIDLYIGLDWNPAATSSAGTYIRGLWTICAAIYGFPVLMHDMTRKLALFFVPFLSLAIYTGLVETAIGGGVSALNSVMRTAYFVFTIAAATRVARTGYATPRAINSAISLATLFLIVAVVLGGIGGMGMRNAYGNENVSVAATVFSSQTQAAFPLLACGIFALRKRTLGRRTAWIIAIGIALMLTAVRAAILAGGVCVLLHALNSPRRHKRALPAAGACALVIVVLSTTAYFFPSVLMRWEDTSGSGRTTFVPIIVRDILDRPTIDLLVGRGKAYAADLLRADIGIAIGAHNEYVDMCSAYGVVGLSLLVSAVSGMLLFVFHRHSHAAADFAEARLFTSVYIVLSLTHGASTYMTFMYMFATALGFVAADDRRISSPFRRLSPCLRARMCYRMHGTVCK